MSDVGDWEKLKNSTSKNIKGVKSVRKSQEKMKFHNLRFLNYSSKYLKVLVTVVKYILMGKRFLV
jgi:hypothetical protein